MRKRLIPQSCADLGLRVGLGRLGREDLRPRRSEVLLQSLHLFPPAQGWKRVLEGLVSPMEQTCNLDKFKL